MEDKKKEKKNVKALFKKKKDQSQKSANKEPEALNKQTSETKDFVADPNSPEPAKSPAQAPVHDLDGSDSDDDRDKQIIGIAKITDKQADNKDNEDDVQADWLFRQNEKKEADQQVKKQERKNAGNITFGGGKPTFGNRRNKTTNILGEDDVGLDQIGDDGKEIQKQKKNTKPITRGDIQGLGSTPVERSKKPEEHKEEKAKPAERPRFFGKAKIGGGEQQKDLPGSNITYDFGVKYKTEHPEGKKKDENGKDDGNTVEVRKDKRRTNLDKGPRFGPKDQVVEQEDPDDDFQIVRDKNQVRRQQRVQARTEDKEGTRKAEEGFTLRKGGAFQSMADRDSD